MFLNWFTPCSPVFYSGGLDWNAGAMIEKGFSWFQHHSPCWLAIITSIKWQGTMNVAFITSMWAAKPNQTKREIRVLSQNILWGRRNDIYVSCLSFNLIVCIGPARKELGSEWSNLLFQHWRNYCHAAWFSSHTSPSVKGVMCTKGS